MPIKRYLYMIFALVLVISPVAISMYYQIPYVTNYFKIVSIYGIYIFVYMVIQMIFASLNKRKMKNIINNNIVNSSYIYNILIVGYREDPDLFQKCLESHKQNLFNGKIKNIIVVIDGNEQEDMYMADIFTEVFGIQGKVYHYGGNFSTSFAKAICILQEHKGKRHVLFTGLNISCNDNVYGVICSDSDTEVYPDAVDNLIKTIESSRDIGAVTGMMEISNPVTMLAGLSYIRYYFACNLERAYQSYNGCVLCVSGPIGIYKVSLIQTFLIEFINQKFMGQQCTYGDDRHLTNNILKMGYKVVYNNLARCKTDTPEQIFRFFNQQVRWCKSSYREFFWNIECIELHSFWMTIDLVYQIFYSLVVLISLIYIFLSKNIQLMFIYFFTVLLVNTIKGIYGYLNEHRIEYLLYSMYGIVYIFCIIPAKIFAGLTLGDTSWGTSSRNLVLDKINFGNIFMVLWSLSVTAIIIYNIIFSKKTLQEYILMGIIILYTIVNLFLLYLFSRKKILLM